MLVCFWKSVQRCVQFGLCLMSVLDVIRRYYYRNSIQTCVVDVSRSGSSNECVINNFNRLVQFNSDNCIYYYYICREYYINIEDEFLKIVFIIII